MHSGKIALKPYPAELREVLEPVEMEVSGSEWVGFEGFCQGSPGKGFEGRGPSKVRVLRVCTGLARFCEIGYAFVGWGLGLVSGFAFSRVP